jgi:hypothetical protein
MQKNITGEAESSQRFAGFTAFSAPSHRSEVWEISQNPGAQKMDRQRFAVDPPSIEERLSTWIRTPSKFRKFGCFMLSACGAGCPLHMRS